MKEGNQVFRTVNLILDSALISAAMLLTFFIRVYSSRFINFTYSAELSQYLWLLAIVVPLCNFLLYMYGFYPTNRLRPLRDVLWIIGKTNLGTIAVCVFLLYAFKIAFIGRIAIIIFAFLNTLFLFLKEVMIRFALRKLRKKGVGLRNVLLIGDTALVKKVSKSIEDNAYLGLNICGYYLLDKRVEGADINGIKVFDRKSDIRLVLLENHIDNAVVAVGKEKLSETEEILLKCEEFGAEIWLYADFFELMFAQKEIDTLDGMPLLVFRTTPQLSWGMVFKRIIDIVGALVLFICALPLFLFTAAGIKLTSPGPVIFKQKRVGLHGRKFVFYKFRSMVSDADQRRSELAGRNIMSGPVFKIKNDPRITRFGMWLRRTSIDELPQLWNVFTGDMSIIGPRPPLPGEVSEYRGWQRRRLSMRPGLSCLWQVQGRNKITDFNEWARLDLEYIDNWSLWLDFVIAFKTVFVVLFRIGAE